MKHGKKYEEVKKLVDKSKAYSLTEAIDLLKKVNYAKFDAGDRVLRIVEATISYSIIWLMLGLIGTILFLLFYK